MNKTDVSFRRLPESHRCVLINHSDCFDCGESQKTFLLVPIDMDLTEQKRLYEKWYRDVYCKNMSREPYIDFLEYLQERGARPLEWIGERFEAV